MKTVIIIEYNMFLKTSFEITLFMVKLEIRSIWEISFSYKKVLPLCLMNVANSSTVFDVMFKKDILLRYFSICI